MIDLQEIVGLLISPCQITWVTSLSRYRQPKAICSSQSLLKIVPRTVSRVIIPQDVHDGLKGLYYPHDHIFIVNDIPMNPIHCIPMNKFLRSRKKK